MLRKLLAGTAIAALGMSSAFAAYTHNFVTQGDLVNYQIDLNGEVDPVCTLSITENATNGASQLVNASGWTVDFGDLTDSSGAYTATGEFAQVILSSFCNIDGEVVISADAQNNYLKALTAGTGPGFTNLVPYSFQLYNGGGNPVGPAIPGTALNSVSAGPFSSLVNGVSGYIRVTLGTPGAALVADDYQENIDITVDLTV